MQKTASLTVLLADRTMPILDLGRMMITRLQTGGCVLVVPLVPEPLGGLCHLGLAPMWQFVSLVQDTMPIVFVWVKTPTAQ
jgi:hypothetical protein